MHHGVRAGFFKRILDVAAVLQIAHDERGTGVHGPAVPLGEIVKNGDRVSLFDELLDADASDVSGTAGDENSHDLLLLKIKVGDC